MEKVVILSKEKVAASLQSEAAGGGISVADPEFPIGGGGAEPLGGCRPSMWALFSKSVCKNKRIGSCWGGGPPGSANESSII